MNFTFYILHSSLPRVRPQGERKAGMALIIVLGLVSLLLISSVTFAIMMRIERASSANARNTTVARQAARSALAYAIAAIDQNIGNKKWAGWQSTNDWQNPVWTCPSNPRLPLGFSNEDRREPQFWKDTFGSIDHNISTNDVDSRAIARILGNQMQHYLAPGIRHRAWAQRYQDGGTSLYPAETDDGNKFVIAPEWVPMTCGTNAVNLDSVIGRCAFLAFDTSGYLDIPALCKGGDGTNRTYGTSAAEIKPIAAFFDGSTDAKKFKKDNQGRPFETVAEICKANPNAFARGSTFSAFNFSPAESMPPSSDALYPKDFVYDSLYPFNTKINIAGDGGEDHLKSLRNHKAAIIAAFMESGLTVSSSEFQLKGDIVDAPCSDEKCTICGGSAPGFTLKKKEVAEQALWAYLGLIDYIDKDDEPAGSNESGIDDSVLADDLQRFARPYVENVPLFNGHVATIQFTRSERANEIVVQEADPQNGIPEKKAYVFDGTNADYRVDVNAKVVFANRCAASGNTELLDGNNNLFERDLEAKLAFNFDGGLWEEIFPKLVENAEEAEEAGDNVVLTRTCQFGDIAEGNPKKLGQSLFFTMSSGEVKVKNKEGKVVSHPDNAEEKNEAFRDFPGTILLGVAGQALKGSKVVSRFPAKKSSYNKDHVALENYAWLVSAFVSADEDASFITRDDSQKGSKKCYEEEFDYTPNGSKVDVYPNKAAAMAGSGKYKLKRKCVNLILWGELLDPRFSCASAAESPSHPEVWPRTVFPSHVNSGDTDNNVWSKCALAHVRDISGYGSFGGAEDFIALMDADAGENGEFDDFVKNFSKHIEYFGESEYFDVEGNSGLIPGYSAFQRYFLRNKDALDAFQGVTDGSRRTENGLDLDDLDSQFHSAYARNGGLDTVGELGFLPIGPYATIRLFGFKDERQFHKNDVDDDVDYDNISAFNQVTKSRPYHRVLDYFGNNRSDKPVRGRINLNSCDFFAVASAFNGVALDDYRQDTIADADETLSESDAMETVAPALGALLDKFHGAAKAATLSDLGRLYDGDYYDEPDYYDEFNQIFTGDIANNMAREAMIRNTCGLFSSRGINMTILLRGEAFTPFFGKSSVQSDKGNTLASRYAIAQVWRDTEPDESGHYPFFVQFFKIFDD